MKIGILHTAFVGDLALLGLLVEALFNEDHELVLFSNKSGVALYKNDNRISKKILVDKRAVKKYALPLKIVGQIKNEKCDALLVPHTSTTSSLISLLSAIPIRIGFNKSYFPGAFTKRVRWRREEHESVRCLRLATAGMLSESQFHYYANENRTVLKTQLVKSEETTFYENLGIEKKEYFVVSPGSVWATKKYPLPFLAEVILKTFERIPEILCCINVAPSELSDLNELKNLISEKTDSSPKVLSRLISLESVTLEHLPLVIRNAQFVISNDSSPLHIASGFNVPVVGIFGPTPIDTGFAPAHKKSAIVNYSLVQTKKLYCQPCSPHGQRECPEGHFRCMNELDPFYILEKLDKLIQK